jgi:phosphate acetyltransferase
VESQTCHSPLVHPRPHDKYLHLIVSAQKLPPVTTAVVHPCDEGSLEGAVEAHKLRLIEPILIGPSARIRGIAARFNIDITGLPIVEAMHSHDSAAKAVRWSGRQRPEP